MITKRPRRLDGVSYVGVQRYFLTICTAHRREIFTTLAAVDGPLGQLRQTCAGVDFALVAYCIMPDHVHVLAYGTSECADFLAFVVHFKKLSGYDYSQRRGKRLWQPGYYERVLRDDESTESVARYTLENPVRAGIASKIGEYPFAGSDLYDVKGMLTIWK